jgi:hypothetical protein
MRNFAKVFICLLPIICEGGKIRGGSRGLRATKAPTLVTRKTESLATRNKARFKLGFRRTVDVDGKQVAILVDWLFFVRALFLNDKFLALYSIGSPFKDDRPINLP